MLTHRSNAQWHHPQRQESPSNSVASISTEKCPTSSLPISGDVDASPPLKKRLPVPPRPSSKRRNNPSQLISFNSPPSEPRSSSQYSERPRFPERETHSLAHDRISGLSDPPKTRGAGDQSIAPGTSSAGEEEMSEMTLNYLRR